MVGTTGVLPASRGWGQGCRSCGVHESPCPPPPSPRAVRAQQSLLQGVLDPEG